MNLVPRTTHAARRLAAAHEQQLIHHDVVSVDVALGELLHEALCLVEAQEFGDTHAHERRLILQAHNLAIHQQVNNQTKGIWLPLEL